MSDLPKVSDIMKKRVVYIEPDCELLSMAHTMVDQGLSCLPVVEEEEGKLHLLGFVTEKDVLAELSNQTFYDERADITAREIMQKDLVTATPSMDLIQLENLFLNTSLRYLPVVEGETLMGMVGRQDAIKGAIELARERGVELEEKKRVIDLHSPGDLRFYMKKL